MGLVVSLKLEITVVLLISYVKIAFQTTFPSHIALFSQLFSQLSSGR